MNDRRPRTRGAPPLAELERAAQRGKGMSERSTWYRVQRQVSLRVTWLLLHTPVTANQISSLMIALAILAGALAAGPRPWMAVLAVGVAYLSYLLDRVDGEIARVRGQESWGGVYLDWLYHRLAPNLLHLGFLTGMALRHPSAGSIVLAATAGPVLLLLKENGQVVHNLYPRKRGAAPEPAPLESEGEPLRSTRLGVVARAPFAPDLAPWIYLPFALLDARHGTEWTHTAALAIVALATLLWTRQLRRLVRGGLQDEITRLRKRLPSGGCE